MPFAGARMGLQARKTYFVSHCMPPAIRMAYRRDLGLLGMGD